MIRNANVKDDLILDLLPTNEDSRKYQRLQQPQDIETEQPKVSGEPSLYLGVFGGCGPLSRRVYKGVVCGNLWGVSKPLNFNRGFFTSIFK